jgi:hypothetical protein
VPSDRPFLSALTKLSVKRTVTNWHSIWKPGSYMKHVALAVICLLTPAIADAANILQYGTVVRLTEKEVDFFVWFDEVPRIETREQVIEFDVDPDSTLPGSGSQPSNFTVRRSFRTLSCSAAPVSCAAGYFSSHKGGDIVGTAPFAINGNLFEMTVPFALLNESDGHFTYAIEDGFPGGQLRQMLYGTAGQTHSPESDPPRPVPEPSSTSLLIAGVGALAFGFVPWSRSRLLRRDEEG